MNNIYKKKNADGFTLVELIVVIAIIAVLLSVIVPNFISQFKDGQYQDCVVKRRRIVTSYSTELNQEYELYLQEKEINYALTFTYGINDYLNSIDEYDRICPTHGDKYEVDGDNLICPHTEHNKDSGENIVKIPVLELD